STAITQPVMQTWPSTSAGTSGPRSATMRSSTPRTRRRSTCLGWRTCFGRTGVASTARDICTLTTARPCSSPRLHHTIRTSAATSLSLVPRKTMITTSTTSTTSRLWPMGS
ncbi:hypothetical protein CRUP_004596, partial [Coryphaenoides rupestris]